VKQAKLQWLQNAGQMSADNLNSIKIWNWQNFQEREGSDFWQIKLMSLKQRSF